MRSSALNVVSSFGAHLCVGRRLVRRAVVASPARAHIHPIRAAGQIERLLPFREQLVGGARDRPYLRGTSLELRAIGEESLLRKRDAGVIAAAGGLHANERRCRLVDETGHDFVYGLP